MNCDPQRLAEARGELRIEPRTLHVWSYSLQTSAECMSFFRRQLSAAEVARSERFQQQVHRDQFVVSHGVLRCVLARYCGVAPHALEFAVEAMQKPIVSSPSVPVSFNLSHSAGRALLAVSDGQPIGVDIEHARAGIDALAIGRRYFFGREFEDIATASQERQHELFFRYWTAKEAVLKAQGVGLHFPLDQFAVAFDASRETATVTSLDRDRMHDGWFVRMLPSESGWLAALAAQGSRWQAIHQQA